MAALIPSVTLNTGHKMPTVGLGTYKLRDELECKAIVAKSLDLGYRLIDTAEVYRNEHIIGNVIKDATSKGLSRDDLFITTKIGPASQGKGKCRQAVLSSIEKLQLDFVDLVLIHWPGVSGLDPQSDQHAEGRQESWEDLEQLVAEGLIRSIGVSNYTTSHLEQLLLHCKVKPVLNQVEFHPLCYQKELLDFCNKNGIVLQAYSSLGSAEGYAELTQIPVINDIAKNRGVSVPQVLLKWALQHNVPVIPKTAKEERLQVNMDLFSFELTQQDMDLIDGLNRKQRFCWNPEKIL
ncbi:Glyoxal reductase [Halotydeus destructor]|nr:Glyoxal reductase [Halotydeus destructor]